MLLNPLKVLIRCESNVFMNFLSISSVQGHKYIHAIPKHV